LDGFSIRSVSTVRRALEELGLKRRVERTEEEKKLLLNKLARWRKNSPNKLLGYRATRDKFMLEEKIVLP
jgi:hypothetical protein